MSGRRIAHGEARKLMGPFMSEEDLVQEGYIGLLRAAKRFDPDRGIRFSTAGHGAGIRAVDRDRLTVRRVNVGKETFVTAYQRALLEDGQLHPADQSVSAPPMRSSPRRMDASSVV